MVVKLSVCINCPYFNGLYGNTSICEYDGRSYYGNINQINGVLCYHPDIPILEDIERLSNQQIFNILAGSKLFDEKMESLLIHELLTRNIPNPQDAKKYFELLYLKYLNMDVDTILTYSFKNWNLEGLEDMLINFHKVYCKGNYIEDFTNLVNNVDKFYDRLLNVSTLNYPKNLEVLQSFVLYLNLTISDKGDQNAN